MPLSLMSFIAAPCDLPELPVPEAAAAVQEAVPGAAAESRSIERQEFRFHFAPGAVPEIRPLHQSPPWGGVVMVTLPGDATQEQAGEAARRLHGVLEPEATVVLLGHDHFRREAEAEDWIYTIAVQQRKRGIGRDEFIQYYQDVYVPNAIAALDDPPYDTYSTSIVLEALGSFEWDGVTLNEYASEQTLRDHMTEQVAEVTSRTSASNFVSVVEKYSGRAVGAALAH
jgi:hypothetical protein